MRLFIENHQCPGDILMLTAAVRDLKKAKPDIYVNVNTSCMPLWDNNPLLDRSISKVNADVVIKAEYSLIHKSDALPYHFIHGFRKDIENKLNITIPQGPYKPDLYLTDKEKEKHPVVKNFNKPYWLINAGYKTDFTCKGWSHQYFQQVVDALKDDIVFIQIGEKNSKHIHKPLNNVINMVGKTTPRQLIQLMYHAAGVISGVSFPMHLAAMSTPYDHLRHAVIIAGGREPAHWETYPGMTFISSIGAYDCCKNGGCWKSRVVPLRDGDDKDNSLCVRPYKMQDGQMIPFCMADISPDDVIRAVKRYRI